ncbi:MAG: protein RarD [Robiginitomaculum sp.]|nr:MAG: protein RarD [Robiginitomaculum sp.]
MAPEERRGTLAAFGAFFFWGAMPLYFWAFPDTVGAFEITLHRIFWTFVLFLVLFAVQGNLTKALSLFKQPKVIATLVASTILISINWMVYAWAAMNGHLAEASLGYFINPLFNVVLGVVILHEKLNLWRWLAVGLAAIGVLNQIIIVGQPPWIALTLAFSFGGYGLLRKTVAAEAGEGLFIETLIVAPLMFGAIVWLEMHGNGHLFSGTPLTIFLLLIAGLTIIIPLTMFNFAARRMPLSTLGLIQYIAPTSTFTMAILVGEKLTFGGVMTFVLIWMGLALYSLDLWRKRGV